MKTKMDNDNNLLRAAKSVEELASRYQEFLECSDKEDFSEALWHLLEEDLTSLRSAMLNYKIASSYLPERLRDVTESLAHVHKLVERGII